MSFQTILAIGSGGFIGAVLRSYLNGIISNRFPHDIPFGTLGVNLLGSFIMGVLIALFMNTSFFSLHVKSFLTTGLLGALTTYSTFALESFFLLEGGHFLLAFYNISLNLFGTIIFCSLGFYIIKFFFKV